MRRMKTPLAIGFAATVAMLAAAATPVRAEDYSNATSTAAKPHKKTVKTHKTMTQKPKEDTSAMGRDTTPPPRSISNY